MRIEDGVGHIGIQAVHPQAARGFAGLDVISGALAHLQDRGVRQAISTVSATNTGVMNLSAFVGFRFYAPRATFHWRAPDAPHLVELDHLLKQAPVLEQAPA